MARGSSPLLVTARIAGSLLVRREVHDEVVATVGAVGRSGFLRTGHGLAAIAGVLTLILLYRRSYSIARHFAVVAVAPFVAGWGVAQYPWTLVHLLTIDDAAGALTTLTALLGVVALAVVLFLPGLLYLLKLSLSEPTVAISTVRL